MQRPAIAWLDSGDANPSIDTLLRLARELGIEFHVVQQVAPHTA